MISHQFLLYTFYPAEDGPFRPQLLGLSRLELTSCARTDSPSVERDSHIPNSLHFPRAESDMYLGTNQDFFFFSHQERSVCWQLLESVGPLDK